MKLLTIALVLLLAASAYADFRQETQGKAVKINPKQIDHIRVKIIQSGTLEVSGPVRSADVVLYAPQDGVESRVVQSGSPGFSWNVVKDAFGNDQLHLEWNNPTGTVDYRIETVVTNRAETLPASKKLAGSPGYLKESSQIVFTDRMRSIAYPFENSLEKAAELAMFVNDYVTYDLGVAGELRPSDWVLENRRGVCVEYANLLSSLLKISGIPTRYIVGYAYSNVENKLIGHTWVEVLAEDGSWIPFDATWLQGGYLDATHIKTSARTDANQTELLTYFGSGSIRWDRNDDSIEILDYSVGNITTIAVEAADASFGSSGFIKTLVSTESCTITEIEAISCVGDNGKELLLIADAKRKLWHCGPAEVYWFFSPADVSRDFIYTCPVTVFDQSGASSKAVVRVEGELYRPKVSISGPGTVSVNEEFSLAAQAPADFIFYSPNLTRHSSGTWRLSLQEPGTYKFFLYSGGALAEKSVTVVEKKEFDISVFVPQNVTRNIPFSVIVSVKNLENRQKTARISVELDERIDDAIVFMPNEAKTLSYTMVPETGKEKLTVAVSADSIASYTAAVRVIEQKPSGIIDDMTGFIHGILKGIADFFGRLFAR